MQGFCLVAIFVPPSDLQKFLGGLFWPQGTLQEAGKYRLCLFEFALVRKTGPLHVYKELWRLGASHPVDMQPLWPSHGAL